jgi:hypothetical protein
MMQNEVNCCDGWGVQNDKGMWWRQINTPSSHSRLSHQASDAVEAIVTSFPEEIHRISYAQHIIQVTTDAAPFRQ